MIPRAAGVNIIATNCISHSSTKSIHVFELQGTGAERIVVTKVMKMHSGWALGDLYPPIYAKRAPPTPAPKIGVVKLEIMTYSSAESSLTPTAFSRKTVIHVCAPHTMNQNMDSDSRIKRYAPFPRSAQTLVPMLSFSNLLPFLILD